MSLMFILRTHDIMRNRVVGEAEDVVGGGMIKVGKTDEEVERNLAFPGFVAGVGVLGDMKDGGDVFLGIAVAFAEVSDTHEVSLSWVMGYT